MSKPVVYVAAGIMVNEVGKILVAERPKGKSMAGFWEFPGGKIEEGEIPEHALIREFKEELGVDIAIDDIDAITFVSYDYEKFHLFMPVWAIYHWQGELKGHEGQRFKWIEPSELDNLPMPPADIPMVATFKHYCETAARNRKDK
ncbi:MAG: 8-oxo-dGTP diphosphatase MutT [Alphaproteobacteria bacterium]